MNKQEILNKLCCYDRRYLFYSKELYSRYPQKTPCSYVNCFYSRAEIAEYALELIEQVENLQDENENLRNTLANEGIFLKE